MSPWEALAFAGGILAALFLRYAVVLYEDMRRYRIVVAGASPAKRRELTAQLVGMRLVSRTTRWWLTRGR